MQSHVADLDAGCSCGQGSCQKPSPVRQADNNATTCDVGSVARTSSTLSRYREETRGLGPLDQEVRDRPDPNGTLQHLGDMYDRSPPGTRSRTALQQAEAIVMEQEYDSVASAVPTPHIVRLVEAGSSLNMHLVIVSNNAAGPIREFVKSQGLQSKFEPVVGRDPARTASYEAPSPHREPAPSSSRAFRPGPAF